MALQTLDRAVAALQALGAAGPMGLRLIHLQQTLGLTKPTTHRLMQALVDHGLARHVDETRRYHLGPSLRLLSNLAPPEGPDLLQACTPAIQRLAEASGDTVFLGARDGLYTVCMSRATGDYPIRAITVEVGSRRPLGIGAGGLALLACLPDEEALRIVQVLTPRYAAYPLVSVEQIVASQRLARRQGYALSDGRVAQGVRGVALALTDATGQPCATIGLAAIRQRMSQRRIGDLVDLLRQEIGWIERSLRENATPRMN